MPPPHSAPSRSRTGFVSAVLQQAAKDLRTSFRDRSTLIQTLLVPLALYPVLFWVMIQANSLLEGQRADKVVSVGIMADDAAVPFAEELLGEWAPVSPEPTDPSDRTDEEEDPDRAPLGIGAQLVDGTVDPEQRLFAYEPIDAVLELKGSGPSRTIRVHTDSSRADSKLAGDRLSEWFEQRGRAERKDQAAALGTTLDDLAPFTLERIDVSESEEIGAFVLSLLLPLMLVVMGTLGAFYPAVDLTAGEHERHTHETTLLAPVPRMAIQLGKVLAVTVCALLAATMNLIGMALAANHLLGMLGDTDISVRLPAANLALALPIAATFLLFTAAVLCAAASLTRTFKQGQSLLGTVQMAFLLPAMVTTMPTLQLSAGLAAVPVVGVALAFRTLLRGGPLGDLPVVPLVLVLVFQLVYAVAALAISLRLLDQAPDGDAEASATDRLRQLLLRSRS